MSKRTLTAIILSFCYLMLYSFSSTARSKKVIVDPSGKGDFITIQAAINSLPDSSKQTITIFIKNGVYKEKISIEKSNIILEGEDEDKTIITQAIARDEWTCDHKDDWGVATVNINSSDITLLNLTITNSYGFDVKEDKTITCPRDTITHSRVIKPTGHQMALRTMNGTRIKAINCHFISKAGDTVSPWNVADGMFYFKDCIMEGGVDLYCPRGWAYAENCRFIVHAGSACIWHDGSQAEDSKTVLKNCSFEGYDGFKLGRYHRDAQFFLIDCTFANNMADTPIYKVTTTNTIKWGHRVYYYNCHRKKGNDFSWHQNNLETAKQHPAYSDINTRWLFGNRWDIN